MKKVYITLLPLIIFFAFWHGDIVKRKPEMKNQGTDFYVGTYTRKNSQGIYKYKLWSDGRMEDLGLAAKSENPSFITKSADNKYLIAVNENKKGIVESFKICKEGLKSLNKRSSGGSHPCFVTSTSDGCVLVANYSSGNIGFLEINNNGKLSALLDTQQHKGSGTHKRQEGPHAHSVWYNPHEENYISVDLGTNELIFLSINRDTKKLYKDVPPALKMETGAGPRHLSFHPTKNWIYVINELNATVSLIKKKEGNYKLISSYSTLPEGFSGTKSCADIHISKDGKFLYASNRGHNSIAVFLIEADGSLLLLDIESTRGNGPRNFALSPDNKFLLVAHQHTDNIVSFKRDNKTGLLEYVSEVKAHTPVCLLF
ncbi:lactonase family protein [Marinilabilia sp.]